MTRSRDTKSLIVIGIVGLAILFLAPQVLPLFSVITLATAIAFSILALSLGLVWGYGGILCFGQTAFFGIGAYAYCIAAINFGGSTWAILVAVLVAIAFAAVIGYLAFYGRVSDVYFAVITLTVSLILYNVVRRTSGPEYKIGSAMMGGFNGIGAPPINMPWDVSQTLFPDQIFYIAMAALLLAYFFCVWLTRTQFGRVILAIRENEVRAELLGYDVRFYKTVLFSIGGGLAAVGGILFCSVVSRITPEVFNLYNAALVIIWVIVGGRGTLIGPVLGAIALYYLTAMLGTQSSLNVYLVLGIVLIAFVLVVPRGIVPSVIHYWDSHRARRFSTRSARNVRRNARRRRNLGDSEPARERQGGSA